MIRNVSDTARWVAYYRAMETERSDAIFRDPFAKRLAGPEGETIVNTMKQGRRMAWAMITRTSIFDRLIMEAIGNNVDLVVNLAAGLDARPWRLNLPSNLRWVDVDLPGILDYKLEQMKGETPHCNYEAVRVDLTDAAKRRALFSQLGSSSTKAVVITEGLLIYLTDKDVAAIATDLHAAPAFKWWITDLAHPRLLKMMSKSWGKEVALGNAPFRFAPAAGTKFFERFGWREAEFVSSMDEARRIKREMRGMWLWRVVGMFYTKKTREIFRRFSGGVLLERV